MLFVFAQTNRVACRHQAPGLASGSVSNALVSVVPLPGWKADSVTEATVEAAVGGV